MGSHSMIYLIKNISHHSSNAWVKAKEEHLTQVKRHGKGGGVEENIDESNKQCMNPSEPVNAKCIYYSNI